MLGPTPWRKYWRASWLTRRTRGHPSAEGDGGVGEL